MLKSNSVLQGIFSTLLLIPGSQFIVVAEPAPAEKKTKEEKVAEKEIKAEEKNAANYEKVKDFSINKYKTDPAFRDKVDAAFEDVMRKHSEEAFDTNIRGRSTLTTVNEDNWRQHFLLYDNLMVQDHINRIGQKLVPPDSEKLYAFRVIPSATPMARALSTGTVYVSTGLISMLDSEAQLSYVLAHEMAHVHLDHWKEVSMMELGVEEYNSAQAMKVAKIGAIASLAGAGIGGAIGKSASSALMGGAIGGLGGLVVGMLMNKTVHHNEWDKVQEDQADELAFKAVLNGNYNVREVPKLYASLEKAAAKDQRIQLGFIGQRKRLKQRTEKAENLINNAMKAEIELKEKNGFLSSSAEHRNLMAELKRDNGIIAFYHDMFDMARTNLQEAVAVRDNDPAAHYFYAKTLKLVGRTDEDTRLAKESFFKATKADTRQQNYGAHLHLALMMAREKGIDPQQVSAEMDTYVTDYARWNAEKRITGAYPPNLGSIYEYIALYGGDKNWKPKVPDMREMEIYRAFSDWTPARPVGESPVAQSATPGAVPAVSAAQSAVERVTKQIQTTGAAVGAARTVIPAVKKK